MKDEIITRKVYQWQTSGKKIKRKTIEEME